MKGGGHKSSAGVSQRGDSPPENSVTNDDSTESLSDDEMIRMHQKLQRQRLEKGKKSMKENSKEDEERFIHNLDINQNDDDQEEEDDGDEEAEEVEEADEQLPKLPKGFYPVEAIRKKRKLKDLTLYFIKWRGWPESANTWEPIENLQTCTDLIEAFEERSKSGKGKSGRKRKRRHGVTPPPQSKKLKKREQQPQQIAEDSLRSLAEMDSLSAAEVEAIAIMESLNAVVTEVGAMVDSSNTVVENPDKLDDGFVHVQVSPGDKGKKEIDLPSIKINEHNVSRSENMGKLHDSSVDVQEPAAPESLAITNEVTSADGQESSSIAVDNAPDGKIRISSTNGIQINGLDHNNSESPAVTKIIKVMEYTASALANTQGVPVSFLALSSDGTEVTVTNEYLRANYPLLLLDFYEQNHRYNYAPQ